MQIRLLITDLDNTLYDWVSFFVPSFYAMIDEAVRILQVDRDRLLDEMRTVHKRYGSSEQPFAMLETPSVQRAYPDLSRAERAEKLDVAFQAFRRVRRETLVLYPGVLDTLRRIRERGCMIVAHTEAPVVNAIYRMQMLQVSPLITALYASATQGLGHPDPLKTPMQLPSHYVHALGAGSRKPAPEILGRIIAEAGVDASETLYVGDSVTRDIAMARLGKTHSALARYGRSFSPLLWEQLVRVTHWTEDDVRREAELRAEFGDIRADLELDSFAELLDHMTFEEGPRSIGPSPLR